MREDGYYWVKETENSEWRIAEWCDDYSWCDERKSWFVTGYGVEASDEHFFEIDERRIQRKGE